MGKGQKDMQKGRIEKSEWSGMRNGKDRKREYGRDREVKQEWDGEGDGKGTREI